MTKRFNAVLLDFDGTLLNSRIVDELATKKLFREHLGRELSDEEFAAYVGLNSKKILEIVAPERVQELEDHYFSYENEHRWRAKLFPGVRRMLEVFHQVEMPLAVVTAQSRRELEINRKNHKIDRYIHYWVTNDDVAHPKPAPDQVVLALSFLGVPPEEAILIGDTRFDMLSGRGAGTSTGAAMWGVHDPRALIKYQPDYLFYHPEEVIKLCLNHAD